MIHHGAFQDDWLSFRVGQRVRTVEGFLGTVEAIEEGPLPTTEIYTVTLDNGMGGGQYGAGELRDATSVEAAKDASVERTAADDYPELGDILERRPNHPHAIPVTASLDSRISYHGEPIRPDAWYIAQQGEEVLAGPFDTEAQAEDSLAPFAGRSGITIVPGADLIDAQLPLPSVTRPPKGEVALVAQWHGEPDGPGSGDDRYRRRPGDEQGVQSEAGIKDFLYRQVEKYNEARGIEHGHHWSYDWCRFRKNSRCFYPRTLDPRASLAAGHPVWVREDRGYCPRIKWQQQRECPVSEPGPNSGEPNAKPAFASLATVAALTDACAQASFRFHFHSAWPDIRAKAKKLRAEGRVRIIAVNHPYVTAEVQGDSDTYETGIMFEPGTTRIAMWECGCPWSTYSWGRSGRWKRYEGRMCAHALALSFELQAQGMGGGVPQETEGFGEAIQPTPVQYPPRPTVARHHVSVATDLAPPPADALWVESSVAGFPAKVRGWVRKVLNLFEDGTAEIEAVGRIPVNEVYYPTYDPTLGLRLASLTTEADANSKGCMVAIYPPESIREAVAIEGGEPVEEMHVTLAYLGNAQDVNREAVEAAVRQWSLHHSTPMTGRIGGYAVFLNGEAKVLVALIDMPGLNEARADLVRILETMGVPALANHGFTPHMTIRYFGLDEDPEVPSELPDTELNFMATQVAVVHGGNRTDFTVTDPFDPEDLTGPGPMPGFDPITRSFVMPHGLVAAERSSDKEDACDDPSVEHVRMPDGKCYPYDKPWYDKSRWRHPMQYFPHASELHDEPEPALPETDGSDDDDDCWYGDDVTTATLQRVAAHRFTRAEQQMLIGEGEDDGVEAGNLDLLDIAGTHYEALEAARRKGR